MGLSSCRVTAGLVSRENFLSVYVEKREGRWREFTPEMPESLKRDDEGLLYRQNRPAVSTVFPANYIFEAALLVGLVNLKRLGWR